MVLPGDGARKAVFSVLAGPEAIGIVHVDEPVAVVVDAVPTLIQMVGVAFDGLTGASYVDARLPGGIRRCTMEASCPHDHVAIARARPVQHDGERPEDDGERSLHSEPRRL
jgi:hypothetical protein